MRTQAVCSREMRYVPGNAIYSREYLAGGLGTALSDRDRRPAPVMRSPHSSKGSARFRQSRRPIWCTPRCSNFLCFAAQHQSAKRIKSQVLIPAMATSHKPSPAPSHTASSLSTAATSAADAPFPSSSPAPRPAARHVPCRPPFPARRRSLRPQRPPRRGAHPLAPTARPGPSRRGSHRPLWQ